MRMPTSSTDHNISTCLRERSVPILSQVGRKVESRLDVLPLDVITRHDGFERLADSDIRQNYGYHYPRPLDACLAVTYVRIHANPVLPSHADAPFLTTR